MSRSPEPLERAYAACDALARSHYENFPVASRLLPKAMRPHVAAVYAFARIADDIADEGTACGSERRVQLAAWRDRMHQAAQVPIDPPSLDRDGLILLALGHSIRSLDLPLSLFDDLLSAFSQDTMTTRYASWADIFDYCRRSANPIGRLVLRIGGYHDAALGRSSDALCTALQLTNFWQDFGRDWRAGRLYVPLEVQAACKARDTDLRAEHLHSTWVDALLECIRVTRTQFAEGRAVCDGVKGRLSLELRFTWLGGSRVLDRVERGRSSLITTRPALSAVDLPVLLWRAARWPAE